LHLPLGERRRQFQRARLGERSNAMGGEDADKIWWEMCHSSGLANQRAGAKGAARESSRSPRLFGE
jgi:hypothetical protein